MTSRPTIATAALLCALAGCTSTSSSGPSSTPASTASVVPSGPVEFVPGSYVIDFDDVRSVVVWDGGSGRLRVKNGSAHDLGAPSISAVTDGSTTLDATIEDAAPIASGTDATFTLVFPDTLDPDHVGLLLLAYGGDSWGAMAPLPAAA